MQETQIVQKKNALLNRVYPARAQICSPYMTVLLTPGPAPSDFDRTDRIDGLDGIEF